MPAGNCTLSFSDDRLRKAVGLETCSSCKRLAELVNLETREGTMVDNENLLQEAQSWPAHKVINWSQLARDYGFQCTLCKLIE